MSQTSPLARLACHIARAEAETNNLHHRLAIGDRLPLGTVGRAEHAENYAREAFAVACGHRIGTTEYTRALAEALADQSLRLDETAAVFEFVGEYDDRAEGDHLTVGQLREAAHAFVRQQKGAKP